jgi:hypothetical protein
MASPAARLAEFYASFRARIAAEAAEDLEPPTRFSSDWYAWQKRHWRRERRLMELAESAELSSFPEDPAPLACEGLEPFLAWAKRQADRRRFRGVA